MMTNTILQRLAKNYPGTIPGNLQLLIKETFDEYEKNRETNYISSPLAPLMHNANNFLNQLILHSQEVIFLVSKEYICRYVSPSANTILDKRPIDLINQNIFTHIHPQDEIKVKNIFAGLLPLYGQTVQVNFRISYQHGNWIWINANVTNFLHDQNFDGFVLNCKDVSEKMQVKTQWRIDQRTRDALINSTNDLMWSFDNHMRLITANEAFLRAIEKRTALTIKPGDKLLDYGLNDPDVIRKWKGWYKKALKGKRFTLEEFTREPFERWAEISFYPIRENNEIIGASCFFRDITEKKNASELIRKSEQMMADAQRISQTGSWELLFDDIGRPINDSFQWSDVAMRIFGIQPGTKSISYKSFFKLVYPEDLPKVRQAFRDAFSGVSVYAIDYRALLPGDNVRWVRAGAIIQADPATGKKLKMVGMVQDITERKLFEHERLRITQDLIQRNKDLEQFAYIISHNLRAPVANILGLSALIESNKVNANVKAECLRGLSKSTRRLDDIIIDLNEILQSKQQMDERKVMVKFRSLVHNITENMRTVIEREHVTIKTDFSEVGEFFSVKNYMHSIFYNLLSNSVKYRRPGIPPIIEISSRKTTTGLELIFRDNGLGIDMEKHREQVFGLYKRFHLEIEGKGMGLFMVKSQVEALGGKISIYSTVNIGTEIIIELE